MPDRGSTGEQRERRLTAPQRAMLELLIDQPRQDWELRRGIPTNATGLSLVANHLYPLIAWADEPEVFFVPREQRDRVEALLDALEPVR